MILSKRAILGAASILWLTANTTLADGVFREDVSWKVFREEVSWIQTNSNTRVILLRADRSTVRRESFSKERTVQAVPIVEVTYAVEALDGPVEQLGFGKCLLKQDGKRLDFNPSIHNSIDFDNYAWVVVSKPEMVNAERAFVFRCAFTNFKESPGLKDSVEVEIQTVVNNRTNVFNFPKIPLSN